MEEGWRNLYMLNDTYIPEKTILPARLYKKSTLKYNIAEVPDADVSILGKEL